MNLSGDVCSFQKVCVHAQFSYVILLIIKRGCFHHDLRASCEGFSFAAISWYSFSASGAGCVICGGVYVCGRERERVRERETHTHTVCECEWYSLSASEAGCIICNGVYVCVRERERGREKGRERESVCV